jgi:hypothetical protein
LAKEDFLSTLLAVLCNVLEEIFQVMLTNASINVFSMLKDEHCEQKVKNLMQLLELPFVSLLARAAGNDLSHHLVHGKKQWVGITGGGLGCKPWWTAHVYCVNHKKILKHGHNLFPAALHLDWSLVAMLHLDQVTGL